MLYIQSKDDVVSGAAVGYERRAAQRHDIAEKMEIPLNRFDELLQILAVMMVMD